jgi:hypothetical protein
MDIHQHDRASLKYLLALPLGMDLAHRHHQSVHTRSHLYLMIARHRGMPCLVLLPETISDPCLLRQYEQTYVQTHLDHPSSRPLSLHQSFDLLLPDPCPHPSGLLLRPKQDLPPFAVLLPNLPSRLRCWSDPIPYHPSNLWIEPLDLARLVIDLYRNRPLWSWRPKVWTGVFRVGLALLHPWWVWRRGTKRRRGDDYLRQ